MSETNETYIPYLATAEAITEADDSPERFLLSIFPGADLDQIGMMKSYTKGKILDGICYGLALSSQDPISLLEAYKFGANEAYEIHKSEREKRGEE